MGFSRCLLHSSAVSLDFVTPTATDTEIVRFGDLVRLSEKKQAILAIQYRL
jgi:hypothetical protein